MSLGRRLFSIIALNIITVLATSGVGLFAVLRLATTLDNVEIISRGIENDMQGHNA